MACFFAVNCGMFNAAHRFGNWAALQIQYGNERVASEHLEIIRDKNDIIVSNGDTLPSGVTAIDRTIMVAGWMVSSFAILFLFLRFLFPKIERDLNKLANGPGKNVRALFVVPALLLSLFEFFYITFGPLIRSEFIVAGTAVGSVAAAWIVHRLCDRVEASQK
jgi:hypothetical protein